MAGGGGPPGQAGRGYQGTEGGAQDLVQVRGAHGEEARFAIVGGTPSSCATLDTRQCTLDDRGVCLLRANTLLQASPSRCYPTTETARLQRAASPPGSQAMPSVAERGSPPPRLRTWSIAPRFCFGQCAFGGPNARNGQRVGFSPPPDLAQAGLGSMGQQDGRLAGRIRPPTAWQAMRPAWWRRGRGRATVWASR